MYILVVDDDLFATCSSLKYAIHDFTRWYSAQAVDGFIFHTAIQKSIKLRVGEVIKHGLYGGESYLCL